MKTIIVNKTKNASQSLKDQSVIIDALVENIKRLNPQLGDQQIGNHIKSRLGVNYEGINMVPPLKTPQFEKFILDLDKGIKATFGNNTQAKI